MTSALPKRRVVLINPPTFFSNGIPQTYERETPHLGLLYLASYLLGRSDRFDVTIIDIGPDGVSLNDLRDRLAALAPFAVGITSVTLQLQGAREVALAVRAACPKTAIFLGGAHVSSDAAFVERHADAFDYGLRFESESTFLESLCTLDDGGELPRVQSGRAIMELDEAPFPARHLIRRESYINPEYMMASRGCPYECYFCSTPGPTNRFDNPIKMRYRSPQNVLDEVKEIVAASRGEVSFADDTFTLNRKLTLELCEKIRQQDVRFRWRCVTRIDRVDDELLAAMRRAGCQTIGFGIEAGSERMRQKVMTKGKFSNEEIGRVVGMCRKHGIAVNSFWIIGNPTETPEEIDETEDMILRLAFSRIAISIPIPLPGSPLFTMAEKDGVISYDLIDRFARKEMGDGATGVYPLYCKDLDKQYLLDRMRRIFLRFYLRPGVVWGIVKRDLLNPKSFRDDLKSMFYLLRRGGSRKRPFV